MSNNACLEIIHKGYCIACNYRFLCIPGFKHNNSEGLIPARYTHKITGIKPLYYSIIRGISKEVTRIANAKFLSLIFTVSTHFPFSYKYKFGILLFENLCSRFHKQVRPFLICHPSSEEYNWETWMNAIMLFYFPRIYFSFYFSDIYSVRNLP